MKRLLRTCLVPLGVLVLLTGALTLIFGSQEPSDF